MAVNAVEAIMSTGQLDRELRVFQDSLPSLMADEGKYALVIGEKIVGTYESYGDAVQAGYAEAGLDPFLVKKISQVEEIVSFTRSLSRCQ